MAALDTLGTVVANTAASILINNSEAGNGSDDTRKNQDGGPSGRRYGPSIPCGYCDVNCIYSAIETLFVVGVLANLLVIFRVIRDKHLHDPTFAAIAALGLADLCFLVLNLMSSFESVILTVTCTMPVLISRPYYILKSIFWFAANSHVALLAILRYIMLAYPLRANSMLSVKRVIYMSVFVWVIGIILMGTLTGLIIAGIILAGKSEEFIIILWGIVYLIPLVVTCILHLIKLFLVRRTTRESATESTRKSIQRMSRIVIAVIVMAAILPLPRMINSFLKLAGQNAYPSADFKTHFGGIADLLFLMNNFINPFIYGFLSKKFRQSVRRMFNCDGSESDDSADTTDTPLSSRRGNFNMEAYRKKSSIDSLDSLR